MDKNINKKLICIVLLLAAAISFFVFGSIAGSIDTHSQRISEIDNKVSTVLKLTATSTLASAGLSAIPGDTATPIAEKIADFSGYFLLILCILYTEKYLLTILGLGAFKILIPLACVLVCAAVLSGKEGFKTVGVKLAAFALALYFAIPLGLKVSDMIYGTYKDSIDTTITAAETLAEETTQLTDAVENESAFSSILTGITESVGNITNKAAGLVKNFIESTAVLIVTSCIIPLLVILFIVWITKLLLGKEANFLPPSLPKQREHRKHTDD